jgi:O-succinylbenzoate synthase
MEGSVGRFFNLSISTLPNYTYPADMSSSSHYFADDIVDDPFESDGGSAQVPDYLSDFGVSGEKLKRYSVASTDYKC